MQDTNHLDLSIYGNAYKVPYPTRQTITPADRTAYEAFTKKLSDYSGLPEQQIDAFEVLIRQESEPLFAIGMARMIQSLAYMRGNQHDKSLMDDSQSWLNRALTIAPDDIDVILSAANVYEASHEHEKVKDLIDRALDQAPDLYKVKLAQFKYLRRYGTIRQVKKAFQAFDLESMGPEERFRIHALAGDAYLGKSEWKDAISHYRKCTVENPDHPWIWHNMSIAYHRLRRYYMAYRCNRKALQLMPFGAAMEMGKEIRTMLAIQVGVISLFIGYLLYQIIL
ncbi:MAG: hypothetical protein AAF633_18905 [Chloroflexota bacterium]